MSDVPGGPWLRTSGGATLPLAVERWMSPPGGGERGLLDRVVGPALDIGCGPGRHVVALGRRGVMALGVDISPPAVHLARARGALVLERSVFDRIPGAGRWGSALLLDGNVGIGGQPVALLERVATLLRPGGRALVEVGEPGSDTTVLDVRVEDVNFVGPWFRWSIVGVDGIASLIHGTALDLAETWSEDGRWFVRLDRE